ncbi:hypothetical protein BC936DRAFT_143208 [Jimgerdemannia flammicorona]|uniref:Cytochrome P450 n=1 Tax=Jimgerdemannia flammicorona TaxID=994334 RepID=A0A432ZZE1_9FUNG|nr:hypothetical protein BC936DRAFT_143208 [Jimgerdemannia flammicorona]
MPFTFDMMAENLLQVSVLRAIQSARFGSRVALVDQDMNIVTEMYRTMLDIIAGMIGAESAPEEFIESLTYLMRVLNNPLLIVSFDGYIMRYVLHHKHIRRVNRFIYKAIAERRAVKAKREKIGTALGEGVTRTMLDILLDVEGEDGRTLTDEEIRDPSRQVRWFVM